MGIPFCIKEQIVANWVQGLLGSTALLFGALVYVLDRDPNEVYFLSIFFDNYPIHFTHLNLPKFIGNSLPTFLHSFSFILITASLFQFNKRIYLIICSTWFLIDSLFEVGQKFPQHASNNIITEFALIMPFSKEILDYLTRSTFDYMDLVSICFATTIAYIVLLVTGQREDSTNA